MKVKAVRGKVLTNALYNVLGEECEAGDLIRIDNTGEVVLAEATGAGAVHGIALQNGVAEGLTTEDKLDIGIGELFPIAVLNSDTVLAVKLPATAENFAIGGTYDLDPTSGDQTLVDAVSTGAELLTIIGWPSQDQSFDPDVVLGELTEWTAGAKAEFTIVKHNGVAYIANTDATVEEPGTGAEWDLYTGDSVAYCTVSQATLDARVA